MNIDEVCSMIRGAYDAVQAECLTIKDSKRVENECGAVIAQVILWKGVRGIDLDGARKCYFAAGGVESDIGPRDDAVWYWRRAAKLWREKAGISTKWC